MSYCLACSFGPIRIHTSLIDIDVVNKLSASQLVMLYQLYHPFLVQGGAPQALTHNRSTMCRCLEPIVWGSISGWNWGCLGEIPWFERLPTGARCGLNGAAFSKHLKISDQQQRTTSQTPPRCPRREFIVCNWQQIWVQTANVFR